MAKESGSRDKTGRSAGRSTGDKSSGTKAGTGGKSASGKPAGGTKSRTGSTGKPASAKPRTAGHSVGKSSTTAKPSKPGTPARKPASGSRRPAQPDTRPVKGQKHSGYPLSGIITSLPGQRRDPKSGKPARHDGVDFSAKVGTPVQSTGDGHVVDIQLRASGYGNMVIIQHAGKVTSRYAHLDSISVKKGQKVSAGDVIGKSGTTGKSTHPHLHYEERDANGKPRMPTFKPGPKGDGHTESVPQTPATIVVSFSNIAPRLIGARPQALESASPLESLEAFPDLEAQAIRQAATEIEPNPVKRDKLIARFFKAMEDLRQAELDSDPDVLNTASNPDASKVQSLLADKPRGELNPSPGFGLELTFGTDDLLGWFTSLFTWFKKLKTRPQKPATSSIPQPMSENARIFLVSDWGTNLYGAPRIAKSALASKPFDMLIHMGDVYYAGTKKEEQENFLDGWPMAAGKISRALNSNHEMYSGGEGYFDIALPAFKQPTSYFAFQNSRYVIIGLDTGYVDHSVSPEQAHWVDSVLANTGNRKVILLSHHQLFSHLSAQGPKLDAALNNSLKSGRISHWFWGHEHNCVIYEPDPIYAIRARCIGHGGMPYKRNDAQQFPQTRPVDTRDEPGFTWRIIPGNGTVPRATILDGPNKYIEGKSDKYGPNGYAVITLDGSKMTEEHFSADGKILLTLQSL